MTHTTDAAALCADKRTRVAVVLWMVPSAVQGNLDREGRWVELAVSEEVVGQRSQLCTCQRLHAKCRGPSLFERGQ